MVRDTQCLMLVKRRCRALDDLAAAIFDTVLICIDWLVTGRWEE